MTITRGALIAVCGAGAHADSASISRRLAAELTRRSSQASVLLTAARGEDTVIALERALARHAIVVADVGALENVAPAVLRLAVAVVCTLHAGGDLCGSAESLVEQDGSTVTHVRRWVAAVTWDHVASFADCRGLASQLAPSIDAVTLFPGSASDPADDDLAAAALVAALA